MTDRLKRFADMLKTDAALLTSRASRIYLSGFDASDSALLVMRDAAYFITDFRYYEAARAAARHIEVALHEGDIFEVINRLAEKHSVKTMAFEDRSLTVYKLGIYESRIKARLLPLEDAAEKLRMTKDGFETENIKKAQRIAEEAFARALKFIRPGVSEREIQRRLRDALWALGSEGEAFEPIVVSGKNTALPHGVACEKLIERGDFVTLDFGAVINHYRSDMTRTIAIGCVSDKMREVYETVLAAQNAALSGIRAGMSGKQCDALARNVIEAAGYGRCFGHSLGHSVGIDIHEAPRLSPRSDEIIGENSVVTVEPGIYIENEFGVRIEDMVVVTAGGCINLTASPKELIILN